MTLAITERGGVVYNEIERLRATAHAFRRLDAAVRARGDTHRLLQHLDHVDSLIHQAVPRV